MNNNSDAKLEKSNGEENYKRGNIVYCSLCCRLCNVYFDLRILHLSESLLKITFFRFEIEVFVKKIETLLSAWVMKRVEKREKVGVFFTDVCFVIKGKLWGSFDVNILWVGKLNYMWKFLFGNKNHKWKCIFILNIK